MKTLINYYTLLVYLNASVLVQFDQLHDLVQFDQLHEVIIYLYINFFIIILSTLSVLVGELLLLCCLVYIPSINEIFMSQKERNF